MVQDNNDCEFSEEDDAVTPKNRLLMAVAIIFCGIAWWWIIKTAMTVIKNIGRWFL